jgi:hypothetical protein
MFASSCGDALKAVVSISLSLAAYSDLTFVDKPTRADADFDQQFVFAFDGEEGGMGVDR